MLLRRFSWCMSLRTGTIVIGIIGLVFSVIIMIVLLTGSIKLTPMIVPDPTGVLTKVSVSFEVVVLVVISVLLIVGAVKYKRWYLVPWLVVSIITLAGMIVADICSAVAMFQEGNDLAGWLYIAYGIIISTMAAYCWMVVFSFFQELLGSGQRFGFR